MAKTNLSRWSSSQREVTLLPVTVGDDNDGAKDTPHLEKTYCVPEATPWRHLRLPSARWSRPSGAALTVCEKLAAQWLKWLCWTSVRSDVEPGPERSLPESTPRLPTALFLWRAVEGEHRVSEAREIELLVGIQRRTSEEALRNLPSGFESTARTPC